MKIIVNRCYGGFNIKNEWLEANGFDDYEDSNVLRTAPCFIAALENGEDINGSYSKLAVVEIPDTATDWKIDEYDGWESIIAVVDGKLVHL